MLCNGDLHGVFFIAELTQLFLSTIAGMQEGSLDVSKFHSDFSLSTLKPEEIVNIGYKQLVFDAFIPSLPERIVDRGPLDPLAAYNLCVGARIVSVSDQRFARAENLISECLPRFDPQLYGRQGKVMDSWESGRHNQSGADTLVLELKRPAAVRYVFISTKYHLGNQAPFVRLEGAISDGVAELKWTEFLARTSLEGHSELGITLSQTTAAFSHIREDFF